MMPGNDGFEICTKLREKSIVPIIMLTARDSDMDYITGITLGSDDYFTKPFSPMSLVMRVKAIFRRIDFENSTKNDVDSININLEFGGVKIDTKNKSVEYNGKIIIYSLGYLIHDTNNESGKKSAIFNIDIDTEGKVKQLEIIPTYIDNKVSVKMYKDINEEKSKKLLEELNNGSKFSSYISEIKNDTLIIKAK